MIILSNKELSLVNIFGSILYRKTVYIYIRQRFLIKIVSGALEVKTETEEEAVLNQQEVLQIVDEEGNIADIVYVDKDVDISQYQLVDALPKVEDEEMSEPQIINMDELMDGSYETSAILENFTDENGFVSE